MEIIQCEQNSPEWEAAKVGIPSASNFSAILASGRGGGPSKTRLTYMRKLAGERITGQPAENYRNAHMDRGHEMEGEAREFYEFTNDVQVERVGFVKNHGAGASPDSLVGDRGLLEIKTALPHILVEHLDLNRVPPEHVAQLQGQMWVTERDWNDLLIYWPGMPPFQSRVDRDDAFIKGTLVPAVAAFADELEAMIARISVRGTPAPARPASAVDLGTAAPAF